MATRTRAATSESPLMDVGMDDIVLIEQHGQAPMWGVVGGWDYIGRGTSRRLQVRTCAGSWLLFSAVTGQELGTAGGRWLRIPHPSEIPTGKKFLRSIELPKPPAAEPDSACTAPPSAP